MKWTFGRKFGLGKTASIAALCVCLMLPHFAIAEAYVGLAQLYRDTREGWHASYSAPDGKTYGAVPDGYVIEVDVPIEVPQLDTLPIVELMINTEPVIDETCEPQWVKGSGALVANTIFNRKTLEGLPFSPTFYPETKDGTAEDNPMTPKDAERVFKALCSRYFGLDNFQTKGVIGYGREPQFFGENSDLKDEDFYKVMEKGVYVVTGEQVFEGIPLLLGGKNEERYFPNLVLYADILDEDNYELCGQTLQQTDVLYEDVPLLPWSQIQRVFEEHYLSQGTLLDVYSVRLGYQLVLPKEGSSTDVGYISGLNSYPEGTFTERYYVRPVWMLRGYEPNRTLAAFREAYEADPKMGINGIGDLSSEMKPPTALERMGGHFAINDYIGVIAVDAQTGEVVYSYYEQQVSDSIGPRILTWEDVR